MKTKVKKIKQLMIKNKVLTGIIVFALVGAGYVVFSSAAVGDHVVSSPAKIVQSSAASGGAFVEFGVGSTGGGGTGTGLEVVGDKIYKDGKVYVAKGFNSVGRLAPTWCSKGLSKTARENFGQPMFDKMKSTWKADAIRFQVSQTGLDPNQRSDHAAYIDHIKFGVNMARQNGFAVILSMQDQSLSCGYAHRLPSSETVRLVLGSLISISKVTVEGLPILLPIHCPLAL